MRCHSPIQLARIALAALIAVSVATAGGEFEHRSKPEQGLRATEILFAKTMAERDHSGFVKFLSDETVFWNGDRELRGRDAVAEAWKPFFEGTDAPFSWAPDAIAVLDSGTLGFTSGTVRDPRGERIGVFNSVWRRTEEGNWEIIFDRGCPPCECP